MTIRFGSKQLSNPTPANIGRIIDIYTALAATVVAWIGTVDFMSSYKVKVIGSILGLTILVGQALKPFFGVDLKGKAVAAEDVAAVEGQTK